MGSRAYKAILPQAQHGAESAEQTSPHMRNPQPGTTPESTGSHITDLQNFSYEGATIIILWWGQHGMRN